MNRRFWVALFALAALGTVPALAYRLGSTPTEIALERTPCFGACPVYKVTLKPDGTVIYEGKRFVEKLGRFEGRINEDDYANLAKATDTLGFWKFKDKYTAPITDMPSALVTIQQGEKSKTTDNYAGRGPAELWAIEQLIDKVVDGVREWKKVE